MLRCGAFVIALMFSSNLVAADDADKAKKLDPAKVFERMDTNGDGKISKEEFKTTLGKFPRLQDKAEVIDKIFGRLDSNQDGFVDKDEAKKLGELRNQLGNRKNKIDQE